MSLHQLELPFDRTRWASVEEQLAAIKQLCRGLERVKVQYDPANRTWYAEAPINVRTTALGATPDEAINKLWRMLTDDEVTITYPHKEDRKVKWDGQRWVDLGMSEII